MSAFWILLALKATLWCAVFYVAACMVPAHHPAARRLLALIGLWGLWALPWLPVPLPAQGGGVLAIPASSMPSAGAWAVLAAGAWVLGSLALGLRLLQEGVSIARLVRRASASGLPRCQGMEVLVSPEVEGPCMTGWWRPCVLLPPDAAAWSAASLRAALRHEAQHARQHDGLHRVCAAVLRALFWWNPAVHALCACYETESEVCCDLEASAIGVSRREYGEMLLAHATGMPPRAWTPSFARQAGLRGRISRLLARQPAARWPNTLRCGVAALLALGAGWLVAAVREAPQVMTATAPADLQAEARLRLSADPFPASP